MVSYGVNLCLSSDTYKFFAGEIVRIGPNEVVFITPKASEGMLQIRMKALRTYRESSRVPDIYDSHTKQMEHFTRTDWLDLGEGEDGINWERDPVRHRQTRKNLSPAFSVKSLEAKEPTLHKHIDYFLERMGEFGNQENGVDLLQVCMPLPSPLRMNENFGRDTDSVV